ncbi:DUF1292 domain-containing protein [Bacillus sp. JCM 19034]|uniref:DUF1292 domain-containing protein n=1 Tax=Bacillus sp. JCM 19034 TaxID=1481928 RepID=UPI000786083F|nr:DUF1292 domain-containing protein [Bacillus sp. JCM 19034]
MQNEEKERIVIPDENGDEHLFDELFRFHVDESDQSYILLTPVGSEQDDSDEEVEVFAFRFEDREGEENDIALFPLESDQEWDMVEEMLNTFTDDQE